MTQLAGVGLQQRVRGLDLHVLRELADLQHEVDPRPFFDRQVHPRDRSPFEARQLGRDGIAPDRKVRGLVVPRRVTDQRARQSGSLVRDRDGCAGENGLLLIPHCPYDRALGRLAVGAADAAQYGQERQPHDHAYFRWQRGV